VSHDIWKTAIMVVWKPETPLTQLQAYGGASSSATHDVQVHGALFGHNSSARRNFLWDTITDWRRWDGTIRAEQCHSERRHELQRGHDRWLEQLGRAGQQRDLCAAVSNANWIHLNLQNSGLGNTASQFISISISYWDNLSGDERAILFPSSTPTARKPEFIGRRLPSGERRHKAPIWTM